MLNDLRYALRILRSHPGFAAVAVCSLAIGIGANSAVYSFADAMILRPLPVAKPSRVVTIRPVSSGMFGATGSISYPDYADIRDGNRTFDGVVASSYSSFGFAAERTAQPQMKFGMFVSGNTFRVLGVTPALGRDFLKEEDSAPGRDAVVILGYELWTADFGKSASVLGRKIWLNGTEFTVVGVTPSSFSGMDVVKPGLFVPLAMAPKLMAPDSLTGRNRGWLDVRARLKPGMETVQAQADVAAVGEALRKAYPKTDESLKLKVFTEFQARVDRSPADAGMLLTLGLLALCVLLAACANVAGLLLSRATARGREIAVRLAIGAGRGVLIKQLLLENFLLALLGSAAGLVVAEAGIRFFRTIPMPTDVPIKFDIQLDARALLFTLAIAVLSTFLFGLTPALRSARLDPITSLKERDATGSRGSRLWGRNTLVCGQVALALILLIVCGILLRGFQAQITKGPGYRIDRMQLMSFDTALVHYSDSQRDLFFRRLIERTLTAPGVETATLTSSIPMSNGNFSSIPILPENREARRGERAEDVFDSVVTSRYFEAMGIPILRGRAFTESDKENTPPVAVVNEHLAEHYWPGQSAIGKRLRLNDAAGKLVQVVGVARQAKYLWISEGPVDFVYLPFAQNPQAHMALVTRSRAAEPKTLLPVLRGIVAGLDRDMPVFDVRTMQNLYEQRAIATPNIIVRTVEAMGIMGLVLAVIGLYGVVSYSVSRRTREFGIRMAVGADRRNVIEMVLRQGLMLAGTGVAIGLVLGILVANAIRSQMLFVFGNTGALPYVLTVLVLLATTAAASYIPARRASLTEPTRALREE